MNKAYTFLTCKKFEDDDDYLHIEGMASTPTPDRYGDVVEPKGARYKTPMPLLWQHEHDKPVGTVTFAKPNDKGIPFKAQIPKIKEEGKLKERVDEAIQSLKYGLVTAVSIGFTADHEKVEIMEEGGYRFTDWEWLELSLVTIPANSEAMLSAVKKFDTQRKAASGDTERPKKPASGRKLTPVKGTIKYINPDKGDQNDS